MALTVDQIAGRVKRLRNAAASRDQRMQEVRLVRQGELSSIFPDHFPEDFPRSVVANFIDYATRDLSELIAPLPSLSCHVGLASSDEARRYASRKNNVGHYYWQHSRLTQNMTTAADRYLSYGFLPMSVEPDFVAKCPRIRLEDPVGAYPQFNRDGDTVSFARVWRQPLDDLCAMFPEHEGALRRLCDPSYLQGYAIIGKSAADIEVEVIRFSDKDQTVLYLPQQGNYSLLAVPNLLGRCPVVVARRPGLDDELRGQFDDVIPVQMARAKMGLLALEAAEKVVQAPMALPDDVQQFAYGADAVIRSRSPEKIKRVGLEMTPTTFAEIQNLEQELRKGGRYPEGRSGDMNASVITGRGVQALLGTIDTQIKTAQAAIGEALRQATSLCFEMDEKLWPNVKKTIRGTAAGQPFQETYTALKAVNGDYECDVTYGFAAGLGPNQALVFLLQLRGDHLIDRATVLRHLSLNEDPTALDKAVRVEEVRDSLQQGLAAYVQSIGVLAQQGMDPSEPLRKAAMIVAGIEAGRSIEALMAEAFAPPPPAPDDGSGQPPGDGSAGGGGPGGELPMAEQPNGLLRGVAPGQAGMSPGGRPDIQMLMAGLTGHGQPNLSASVSRRVPA